MSWNLPKLPGYNFQDPGKTSFHLPHKLKYKNGYSFVRLDPVAIGRTQVDSLGTQQLEIDNSNLFDPRLIYGKTTQSIHPVVQPHYVLYDKKILIFKALLGGSNQGSLFTPADKMRLVNVIYYLEDDTLSVDEPHVRNSGLLQGKVIKRGRILKDDTDRYWHWKDLNIGIDMKINGMIFHTVSCDYYTRKFLNSQGIQVMENEESDNAATEDEYEPSNSTANNQSHQNLRRYLLYDNKTLKFDAIWDDSASEHGEIRNYKMIYFLYDNTIAIKEIHKINEGRDPFPMLLNRTRIPKNWKKHCNFSNLIMQDVDYADQNDDDYYSASDLLVGSTVNILGRPFLIYDCDTNTRDYYKNVLHITQPLRIEFRQNIKASNVLEPPPHIGIGDPEDTLMSCFSFHSKPPHKNLVQYNLNANMHLRYLCEMISVHPEDRGRKFVLLYNLADGTIRIDELPIENSGVQGGRFFGPNKVRTPGGSELSYYTPDMFYIGALVLVNQHKFSIIGTDLFVYNYIRSHPDKFPSEVIENIRQYHAKRHQLKVEEEPASEVSQQFEKLNLNDECSTAVGEKRYSPVLTPVIQGLDVAQSLPNVPETAEPKNKGPPFVCITGLTQSENPQETQYQDYDMNCKCDTQAPGPSTDTVESPDINVPSESVRRVKFADSFEECP